jgi:hypothetical protein
MENNHSPESTQITMFYFICSVFSYWFGSCFEFLKDNQHHIIKWGGIFFEWFGKGGAGTLGLIGAVKFLQENKILKTPLISYKKNKKVDDEG